MESSIHVGGPDGSGSLTLDNSTVRVMTIWAGLTENSTFKGVYVYNATTESTDSTSERYSNGVYQTVTDANGTTRNFGEADIKITNGSKVHLLTNAELGQGTMTVDNATVEVGSCVWLGHVDGAKSVLNVVNGGVITGSSESAGFLYTSDSGYGVTPGTTSVEVNVKGEGSKIDLGKTMKFTAPDSKMNITESGSVSAGWVIFSRVDEQAGSVAVNVGAGSTLEATYSLTAYSGTEIDNAGSMSAAELTLEGALLTNRGNIMIDGAMSMSNGATLNLVITDFANLPSLTVESLSVTEGASLGLIFDNLTLADEAMASLMGAQMLGTDGEAVDFTNLIKITGAGALQDAIDADTSLSLFYYGDNGEVLEYTAGTNEQVSVGIAQVASIPEPTTATLSLLALAALAARRRR